MIGSMSFGSSLKSSRALRLQKKTIKVGHFDFDDIDLFAQSTRKQSNRSVGQRIGDAHTKVSQCGDPTDRGHRKLLPS
jgi:hypothetical protein